MKRSLRTTLQAYIELRGSCTLDEIFGVAASYDSSIKQSTVERTMRKIVHDPTSLIEPIRDDRKQVKGYLKLNLQKK